MNSENKLKKSFRVVREYAKGTLQEKIPLMYIFLFWELRGLSPNFYIDVSVIDLYRVAAIYPDRFQCFTVALKSNIFY